MVWLDHLDAGGKLRDFYELFSCGRWLHLIQGWV
jgi:hypothetical protein